MRELGVDVLLLSTGADLPYLTGYEAMPLERLTMLVLPVDGDSVLVIPRLEAPRVVAQPDAFEVFPWEEYTLARSLVDNHVPAGEFEDDLFAGLREPVNR